MKLEVDNFNEVKKRLTQSEGKALHSVGGFVEAEMKVRAPVDTGNLRGSINYVVDENEKSVTIGTPVEYGPKVEYGTVNQSPQPYMEPALKENVDRIKELIRRAYNG